MCAASSLLERGGKKRLVAGSLEPGTGVSAMAREAGFHPSQLYGWRRRRLRVRREAVPEFAAVRIAAEPAPSEMPATGTIEVELRKVRG